jgi:hypothetical protein
MLRKGRCSRWSSVAADNSTSSTKSDAYTCDSEFIQCHDDYGETVAHTDTEYIKRAPTPKHLGCDSPTLDQLDCVGSCRDEDAVVVITFKVVSMLK